MNFEREIKYITRKEWRKKEYFLLIFLFLTGFAYGFTIGIETSYQIGYIDVSSYLGEDFFQSENGNCQGCYLKFLFPNRKVDFIITVKDLPPNKTYLLYTSSVGYFLFPRENGTILLMDSVISNSHLIFLGRYIGNNSEIINSVSILTFENFYVLERHFFIDFL